MGILTFSSVLLCTRGKNVRTWEERDAETKTKLAGRVCNWK